MIRMREVEGISPHRPPAQEEFAREHAALFVHLRRALLCVASETWRRHFHLLEPPYALVCLADERLASAEGRNIQEHIEHEFWSKNACCHRPGVARQLRERMPHVDLMSDDMLAFMSLCELFLPHWVWSPLPPPPPLV